MAEPAQSLNINTLQNVYVVKMLIKHTIESNTEIIQIAAVAYTIGPIFKRIIDCVQLYFTNDFTNIILQLPA